MRGFQPLRVADRHAVRRRVPPIFRSDYPALAGSCHITAVLCYAPFKAYRAGASNSEGRPEAALTGPVPPRGDADPRDHDVNHPRLHHGSALAGADVPFLVRLFTLFPRAGPRLRTSSRTFIRFSEGFKPSLGPEVLPVAFCEVVGGEDIPNMDHTDSSGYRPAQFAEAHEGVEPSCTGCRPCGKS